MPLPLSDVIDEFHSVCFSYSFKNNLQIHHDTILFSFHIPAADSSCLIHRMESANSRTLTSECGVILSPRFPGLIQPGLYFWEVASANDYHYYEIYLYYVVGPNIKDDCTQHFARKEETEMGGMENERGREKGWDA